ncbi:MAG: 3'(2'),5'-bisphosphate nucleotidase CysQ [Caulobacteraceae bacterium]
MDEEAPVLSIDLGERLSEIVVEASMLILPFWRAGAKVEFKADRSPVTEADRRAESLILERLAADFPDVPVISEEDFSKSGPPLRAAERFFLVDPLDGTKAFVRGDPHFTVNIGLIERARPVAGAVASPATEEVWYASGEARKRGFGARAGRAIAVRPWRSGEALALVSHTMDERALESLARRYGFARFEAMDSSVKLCRIAEGAADIYPRHGRTMEWDTAAGHAILTSAGGALTTPEGDPFLYGKDEAGFSNGWFVARGGGPEIP